MYVLRLDGAAVAVMYGFFYNRQFYFYQHGFDERFTPHSVGLVLMAKTIQAAMAEGAHTFDLLWGVEPYKFLWAREQRPLHRVELFPAHAAGRVHRDAVRARREVGRAVRALIAGARGSRLGARWPGLTGESRIPSPESREQRHA